MRKTILFIAATFMVAMALGQSQQLQTIKGTTKDKKRIEVQYYKGAVQDYIESVNYQLVEELNADNKKKQNSINELQLQLNKANKQIDNLLKEQQKNSGDAGSIATLNEQLEEKQGEIDQLNGQVHDLNARLNAMQAENDRLRLQLDSIKAVNLQLGQGKGRQARTPVVGVEANMGTVILLPSNGLNPWEGALSWNKQAAIYLGTAPLSGSLPVAIEAGVGFRSLPMAAKLDYYESGESYEDCDGACYRPIIENLSERLTMNCVEIPIRLCIGRPDKDKVSVYAKLGVSPSFLLSSRLANGVYTRKGYYPSWNVTFEEIGELGFFDNGGEGSEAATPNRRFNLWGNAAFGAYVPLGSSLLFSVGVQLEYPFMTTGTFEPEADMLPFPDGLLKYDGRMLIPNLQAGLVYTFRR